MKVLKFTPAIFISFLLIAALSNSVCAKTGNGSNETSMFRIPKKITCVDDLPKELRQDMQKKVVKIQLFPEEVAQDVREEIPEPIAMVEDFTYHVVTGSFNIKKNAHRLAKTLKNNGYEQTSVEFYENEGLYRVIVQRYDNEDSAEAYIHQFKAENPKLEEAWVYQGKKMQREYLALSMAE